MYGDDAAGRRRSRCVARRPHFRHIVRPADMAQIWSRLPRRRCCAGPGAAAVVADLQGDVEWTADGCEAAVFTAAARHLWELGREVVARSEATVAHLPNMSFRRLAGYSLARARTAS
jgi:hypothetical protein